MESKKGALQKWRIQELWRSGFCATEILSSSVSDLCENYREDRG
jgi:hypothetical protein